MLPTQHRLRKEQDVKAVVMRGRSVFDSAAGVKFKKNNLEVSRFTIVVGLKVSKSAAVRNRVKRQYREIIHLALEKIKPGFDVVFLTSAKAIDLDYQEKEERLMGVLKKAKLLL